MARPREFDISLVLQAAINVFWSKGYNATSLEDLLQATGLSKSSLYGVFGSKEQLFLEAFNAYRKEHMRELLLILNSGETARQSIERFFRAVIQGTKDQQRYGCMTANQAVELAPHDPKICRLVKEDFRRVEDAFEATLRRGHADGSITKDKQPRRLARFLVVALQGLQVMVRSVPNPSRLTDAVEVLLSVLGD